MMLRSIFAVLLSLVVLFSSAFAHPGSLDENGGHYDRQNGGYHYHPGTNQGNNPTGEYTGEWAGKTSSSTSKRSSNTSSSTDEGPFASVVFIILLSVGAVVGMFLKITSSIENKRVQDEREVQAKIERQKRRSYYLTHDIRSMCGMPEYAVVGNDGIPRSKVIEDGETYGKPFDVYVSPHGYTYHRRECKYAHIVANAITDRGKYKLEERRPCLYCHPGPLPDGKWFSKYMSCISECEQLEVTPMIDPLNDH